MNCTCPPWDGKGYRSRSLLCVEHGDPLLTNVKETTMSETHIEPSVLCQVDFSKSSSKDGGTGYRVSVSHGCQDREALRVFILASELKEKADALVAGKTIEEALQESLAK